MRKWNGNRGYLNLETCDLVELCSKLLGTRALFPVLTGLAEGCVRHSTKCRLEADQTTDGIDRSVSNAEAAVFLEAAAKIRAIQSELNERWGNDLPWAAHGDAVRGCRQADLIQSEKMVREVSELHSELDSY